MTTNRRRIFLINPSFQIRFCVYISLLVFIASLFYPIGIYEMVDQLIQKSPAERQDIESMRQKLLLTLAVVQFFYILCIFIFSIFMSHRIAGPIYKLKKFLAQIRSGDAPEELRFRKEDYFKDLADDINVTIRHLLGQGGKLQSELDSVKQGLAQIKQLLPPQEHHRIEKIQRQLNSAPDEKSRAKSTS